jgi:drug/metabolite transporter (DMT)-like permease
MSLVYLASSIALGTIINLIFRWFKEYNVNKFQAIVVNYLTCFIVGFAISPSKNLIANLYTDWFLYSICLGLLFVTIFYAMALTTEKLGISVNAVSSKMSVIIPVSYAYFMVSEPMNVLFIVGVIISLTSIYLISVKKQLKIERKYYLLPILVFLGSGAIDTSLKILELKYASVTPLSAISYTIFLGAFIAGLVLYLLRTKGKLPTLNQKNITAGVLLGIPNFFSIFFLLKAIEAFSLKSAFVFGINNISIVLVSSVLSILIFKEHLTKLNKIGLILAIVSIVIISYAA